MAIIALHHHRLVSHYYGDLALSPGSSQLFIVAHITLKSWEEPGYEVNGDLYFIIVDNY